IVDANSQWDDIKNIKVRNFNFTAASGMDTHTQIGCVAQEVETVSPKLISEKDGVKSVSYSVLYMKAVKALQEAQTRIETLESKVAALEG
ncbi:MAG: tail fiber domain-containing protein, partial [Pseudomonadota bacterium]|nr:tail fiber domain-containing protein [Pseudomonadota bacterium]